MSTNGAYLEPARTLSALTIIGDSLVDQLVFSADRVTGVQLATGEQYHSSEVVLSAGVIHSPAILMRSGIGPADDLSELGIKVRADLPVGRNIQDHPMITINLPLSREATGGQDDRHTNCCVRYSSGADPHSNDMLLVSLNQNVLAMEGADLRTSAGAIGVWVNQTYSRGSVKLTSTSPSEQPMVRERMLSDERDLSRLSAGVQLLAELAMKDGVAGLCTSTPERANESLWHHLGLGAASLDEYLLANATDTQHGTSTCRMGSSSCPTAVVDSECKVLGVPGVRVIDASIFPSVTRRTRI